jgi:hypothetical protein
MLTTHYLTTKLRMRGGIPLLPHTRSWHGQGQLYLVYFYDDDDDDNDDDNNNNNNRVMEGTKRLL